MIPVLAGISGFRFHVLSEPLKDLLQATPQVFDFLRRDSPAGGFGLNL